VKLHISSFLSSVNIYSVQATNMPLELLGVEDGNLEKDNCYHRGKDLLVSVVYNIAAIPHI